MCAIWTVKNRSTRGSAIGEEVLCIFPTMWAQSTRAESISLSDDQSNVSQFMLGTPRMTLSLNYKPTSHQVSRTLLVTRLTIQIVLRESIPKPSTFLGFICLRGPVSSFPPPPLYLSVYLYWWDRVALAFLELSLACLCSRELGLKVCLTTAGFLFFPPLFTGEAEAAPLLGGSPSALRVLHGAQLKGPGLSQIHSISLFSPKLEVLVKYHLLGNWNQNPTRDYTLGIVMEGTQVSEWCCKP